MEGGRSSLNNEHLGSGCFKSQLTKIQCYFKSTGAVYSRHTFVTLEESWQLPGQYIQDPFHDSDLTGALCHTWQFWPPHPLWDSLPPDLSYHELALFIFSRHFSVYIWLLFLSPALWLGNFPKLGPRPLLALLFVYSPLAHLSNSHICTGIISVMNSSQLQGPADHVPVSSNTAYQEWNYVTPFLRTFNGSSFPLR